METIINPIISKFFEWFDKEKRKIFMISFVVGILVNILVLTNDLLSTDSILMGEVYLGSNWDLSLGRWMLKILGYFRFALSSPVICGCLSVILMSITNVLLLDLFKIKNKISKTLIAILLASSPFFTEILLSPYCSFEFTLAFLLSVLGVYILYNFKNNLFSLFLASLFLSFSLGIYQAFLGVTCALCILIPLTYLIKGEITISEFLKKILVSLSMGIVGIIFYEIFLRIFLKIFNVTLSTYGGANEIGLSTLLAIPKEIKNAYFIFYNYFVNDNIINNLFYRRHIVNIFLLITLILVIIKLYTVNKNKKKLNLALCIALSLLLLPVAMGILALIAPERDFYALMSAPFVLVYIFIFALIDSVRTEKIYEKILCVATLGALIFVTISHLVMSNATYMSARITKEKTVFAANKIVNDIYNLENFDPNYKVLFIGRPISNFFSITNKVYELSSTIGFYEPQMWEEPHLCNSVGINLLGII